MSESTTAMQIPSTNHVRSRTETRKISPRKAARIKKVHGSLPQGVFVKTRDDFAEEDRIRKAKIRRKMIHHRYMQETRLFAASYYVQLQRLDDPNIQCVRLDENLRPIRRSRPSGWWYHELFGHILETDQVCRYCMAAPITTLDHVWPIDLGGCSHLHNLVGACEPCNQLKSNMHPKAVGMKLHLPKRFFDPESNIEPKDTFRPITASKMQTG